MVIQLDGNERDRHQDPVNIGGVATCTSSFISHSQLGVLGFRSLNSGHQYLCVPIYQKVMLRNVSSICFRFCVNGSACRLLRTTPLRICKPLFGAWLQLSCAVELFCTEKNLTETFMYLEVSKSC